MRTSIDATWLLVFSAQIARGGFLFHHGFFSPWVFRIIRHHLKRMEVDIAIRAILRAESAAHAPIFDHDLERIPASYGAHRAAHHAKRVFALSAGCGDQIFLEAKAFAN